MVIAYKSTSEEIGFLREMFEKYDLQKDGELTFDEFRTVLADYEYSNEELELMFRALDLDGSGQIHYRQENKDTTEWC